MTANSLHNPLRLLTAVVLCLAVSLAVGAAKPPTDAQLQALCRDAGFALQSASGEDARQSAFSALTTKLEQQADIARITPQQVDMVFESGGTTLYPFLSRWLQPFIQGRADKGEDVFVFYAWKYLPGNDGFTVNDEGVKALGRFLSLKTLSNFFAQYPDAARDVVTGMGDLKSRHWAEPYNMVQPALNLLGAKLPQAAATECVKVFNAAALADSISADDRESIRKAALAQYQQIAATTDNQRIKKNCEAQMAYLEGPFACGTLVGQKAPELHFRRVFCTTPADTIGTADIPTLSSLFEGSDAPVVMLDFWGTKCVPCLQSFPELAEIQQHFAGKKVVILGVTSLMGYFVDTPNHRTIQCQNKPEKELSLFPAYMKAMGVNWNIAISEEDVMNTDYGALAIPHVVLIDRQGRVRHNALSADKDEKIALIEQLLNE